MADGRECVVRQEFDSFGAFVRQAVHGETEMESGDRHSITGSLAFCGTETIEEAERLALNGWPAGLEKIKRFKAKLDENVGENLVEQKLNYDVAGGDWDIGRVLIGEPEAAMVWEEHETEKRIVHIVLSGGVSCQIGTDIIFRRGAGVCGLVDALEKSGTRCQVTLAFGVDSKCGKTIQNFIRIKDPDAPADIDRIIFALCHASTLRRIAFSLWEQYPAEVRNEFKIPGLYGFPGDLPPADRGDIYIECARAGQDQWLSDAATTRWILDSLKKQGVELREVA